MNHPARYGWPAFLVAGGVALGTFALRGWFQPEAPPPVSQVLAQMDFQASGLSVVRYDELGTPGFTLQAPRAERFRAEDALALLEAEFTLADRDGEGGWEGHAQRIEVRPDESPLQLSGEVLLERSGEPMQLRSPELWLDPQARRAWGEQSVELERPGSVVEAQQFEVDLERSAVQLGGRVSGQFESRAR